jgi:hypothetical protein
MKTSRDSNIARNNEIAGYMEETVGSTTNNAPSIEQAADVQLEAQPFSVEHPNGGKHSKSGSTSQHEPPAFKG